MEDDREREKERERENRPTSLNVGRWELVVGVVRLAQECEEMWSKGATGWGVFTCEGTWDGQLAMAWQVAYARARRGE